MYSGQVTQSFWIVLLFVLVCFLRYDDDDDNYLLWAVMKIDCKTWRHLERLPLWKNKRHSVNVNFHSLVNLLLFAVILPFLRSPTRSQISSSPVLPPHSCILTCSSLWYSVNMSKYSCLRAFALATCSALKDLPTDVQIAYSLVPFRETCSSQCVSTTHHTHHCLFPLLWYICLHKTVVCFIPSC